MSSENEVYSDFYEEGEDSVTTSCMIFILLVFLSRANLLCI
jgi:hypothetical protein